MDIEKTYFLSLDFETTGLLPCQERYDPDILSTPVKNGAAIIQFGAILLDEDLNLVSMDHDLVCPETHDSYGHALVIDNIAMQVNGLDIEECRSKGIEIRNMLERLQDLCDSVNGPIVLTGSNPAFDLGFWQEACRQTCGDYSIPKSIRRRLLDTYEMNVHYLYTELGFSMKDALNNGSLPKFMKIIDTPHKAHDALGDAVAVWKCLALHFKGAPIVNTNIEL